MNFVVSSRRIMRLLVLLAALFVLPGLLAACSKEDSASAPEPQPGAVLPAAEAAQPGASSGIGASAAAPTATPFLPQGDLVLWHSWAGPDAEALTAILTDMKAAYPLVNVDTLYVSPNDLPQAFADAVAANGGPDLAVTENWWINDMVAANVIRPLDDLVRPGQTETFFPAALASFQRDGFLYALPATYELVALYQNTALAAAGTAPATTDDLLAQARATPEMGLGLYASLYHLWWGFPAYGAVLFDADGKVVLDRGDGAAGFLAWIKALDGVEGSFVDTDYGMLLDRFSKGEFAYFVDGPWAAPELRAALGANLAVVPLPAGPAGAAAPWLSAEGVILNPSLGPEKAQLAFFLASILTDTDSGSRFAAGGRLPANQSAALPDDPLVRGFALQAATAQPAPPFGEMESVWGYGGDMLVKVLGGSMEPAEAVRETAALINEEIGK